MATTLLDPKTEQKTITATKPRQRGITQRQQRLTTPAASEPEIYYPDSDGEPMAETEIHVRAIFHLYGLLCAIFRHTQDVYIATNMFMYYRQGEPKKRKAPDIMVAKGVVKRIRRTFKIWEEKTAPAVVFEFTSKATIDEDTVSKSSLYALLGIKEYFLFDPEADYLDEQFIGYRLHEGEYERIEFDQEGAIHSQELDLRLKPDGLLLRIIDPMTGNFMVGYEDIHDYATEAVHRARQELQRAEQAETELAQLRAELDELQRQSKNK